MHCEYIMANIRHVISESMPVQYTCRILHDVGIIHRKQHADTDREDSPLDNLS